MEEDSPPQTQRTQSGRRENHILLYATAACEAHHRPSGVLCVCGGEALLSYSALMCNPPQFKTSGEPKYEIE